MAPTRALVNEMSVTVSPGMSPSRAPRACPAASPGRPLRVRPRSMRLFLSISGMSVTAEPCADRSIPRSTAASAYLPRFCSPTSVWTKGAAATTPSTPRTFRSGASQLSIRIPSP
jgi:hypothetical protein